MAGKRKTRRETCAPQEQTLQEEIEMLRSLIRKTAERAEEENPLPHQVRLLEAFSQACARLAQMLKVQSELSEDRGALDELFHVADEIFREMSGKTGGG